MPQRALVISSREVGYANPKCLSSQALSSAFSYRYETFSPSCSRHLRNPLTHMNLCAGLSVKLDASHLATSILFLCPGLATQLLLDSVYGSMCRSIAANLFRNDGCKLRQAFEGRLQQMQEMQETQECRDWVDSRFMLGPTQRSEFGFLAGCIARSETICYCPQ